MYYGEIAKTVQLRCYAAQYLTCSISCVLRWNYQSTVTLICSSIIRYIIHVLRCNRPISQIPQCIRQISHNAPFCNRNVHICAHFCYKMLHYGIWHRGILGFVKWVYYQKYVFGVTLHRNNIQCTCTTAKLPKCCSIVKLRCDNLQIAMARLRGNQTVYFDTPLWLISLFNWDDFVRKQALFSVDTTWKTTICMVLVLECLLEQRWYMDFVLESWWRIWGVRHTIELSAMESLHDDVIHRRPIVSPHKGLVMRN